MESPTKPVVIVTGGAGYVGSHTAKALANAGYLPVTIDNLSRGYRDAVKYGPFIAGSVGDAAMVGKAARLHRPVCVLHFAAFTYVDESVREPGRYFRNNVSEMESLLSVLAFEGIDKVVFSSSCATYGLVERSPISEDTPQAPVSPYGETKLMGERMLHWFGGLGIRHVALRYFNAAGADPTAELGERHEPETHLIPNAVRAALGSGPPLQVFGTDYNTPDGTAIRDYVHVTDLADAHVRAVRYLMEGGANLAVNLGSGVGHSVLSVVKEIERLTLRDVPRVLGSRRAGDAASLFASAERARASLGWEARSDLESICRTAIAWEAQREI